LIGSLTRFAVSGRYPGFDDPPTEIEYSHAVDTAASVVKWAESVVAGG